MADRKGYINAYFKEKRVTVFVPEKYQKLTTAFAYDKSFSKSGAIVHMIRQTFENMSEAERQKYLAIYDRLTPEEKKNPKI